MTQLFKTLQVSNEKVKPELQRIFPTVSQAKLAGAVFDGPQIKTLFNDKHLPPVLSVDEIHAFESLKTVCKEFLGNSRSSNHIAIVKTLISSFQTINVNVTIKLHVLMCQLDNFRSNCGDFSDEQGERFHQTFKETDEHLVSTYVKINTSERHNIFM